jgi:hypothetical protein
MKIGDLVTLTPQRVSVQLINYGQDPPEGGIVDSKELCIILDMKPPGSSIWGKIKVLGQRGNIGWADDGLFYVISNENIF